MVTAAVSNTAADVEEAAETTRTPNNKTKKQTGVSMANGAPWNLRGVRRASLAQQQSRTHQRREEESKKTLGQAQNDNGRMSNESPLLDIQNLHSHVGLHGLLQQKVFATHSNDDQQQPAADIFFSTPINSSSSSSLDNNLNSSDHSKAALHLNTRVKGLIDGHPVTFELCQAVNEPPNTSRQSRTRRQHRNINVTKSHLTFRCRLRLQQFGLFTLSVIYLACFVLLNVIFSILWYFPGGNKCCDDPEMTYGQTFDFAVQTSTTIGYGGYVPDGTWSNFLVVLQSTLAVVLTAIYGGLLFAKVQTPQAKFVFSDMITLSNVNGLPCLEVRVGNADVSENPLIDAEARLSCTYMMRYQDSTATAMTMRERGDNGQRQQQQPSPRTFTQTEPLKLMHPQRDAMTTVWTLRHVIDETSPLFGMRFDEWPGSTITDFRVGIKATQAISNASVSSQTAYQIQDVMVGYRFCDQVLYDEKTQTIVNDFGKMNDLVPQAVWYPVPIVVTSMEAAGVEGR